MATDTESLEQGMEVSPRARVMADLKILTRDAEDLLRATVGDVSEKAKEARVRMTAALERAKITCAQLQEQTGATARAAARKADNLIREHPYESLGVAFGVGLLLGALLARK
ncbi:MAG TPA: DUF883 family protein [Verrucomicrobiota bacterium]|nr:DUF883 family protein [Verrucomicrobiota bacterium]HNT15725.1 DUF883 family protein [Verrucomicrobiota bacterium]